MSRLKTIAYQIRQRLYHRLPRILTASIVLAALFTLQILLLILLTRESFNHLRLPIGDLFGLLNILWKQNLWQALHLLLFSPLLLLGHSDTGSQLVTWGIYIYPLTLLHYLAVSLLAARAMQADTSASWRGHGITCMAVFISIIPALYLSIASHCTSPTWVLKVLLRELQTPFWGTQELLKYLPEDSNALFTGLQLILYSAGYLLLIFQNRHAARHANGIASVGAGEVR